VWVAVSALHGRLNDLVNATLCRVAAVAIALVAVVAVHRRATDADAFVVALISCRAGILVIAWNSPIIPERAPELRVAVFGRAIVTVVAAFRCATDAFAVLAQVALGAHVAVVTGDVTPRRRFMHTTRPCRQMNPLIHLNNNQKYATIKV